MGLVKIDMNDLATHTKNSVSAVKGRSPAYGLARW
jgi:hypothetical protein